MFVCYRKLKVDKGRFDFFMYYLHRYIRLTPPFIMVSMILLLDSHWWNGPLWHETVDRFINGCHKYWWTNLLYISSWMKTEEVCLPHGWYLSCDMQYFIIAPIFFMTLYRKPTLGFSLIAIAAFLSMAATGIVTYIYDLGPVALFSIPDDDNVNMFLNYIGFRPYAHFASFAVGLVLGYLVYRYKEIKISRKLQLVGWLSAVTTGLTILYGVYDWNANSPPGTFMSILYGSTSRPVWTLCVAWVTFACVTGHGGYVNTLLSWRAFVPLSKMTFMVYLLHPPLMFAYAAHVINSIYVTQFMVVYTYLAHIMACCMCAFLACILWESPFINVEKIVLDFITDWRRQRRKEVPASKKFPKRNPDTTSTHVNGGPADSTEDTHVVSLPVEEDKPQDSAESNNNSTSIRL
ncbi:nose resistant to fluoxetine protein 6-like [Ornithodoros turicata]|uniref:nose resistant to fluoxetine protein 6-like n=1 Tax=Ornithodoros turicata TaxID=34597 RepID=UPI0031388794